MARTRLFRHLQRLIGREAHIPDGDADPRSTSRGELARQLDTQRRAFLRAALSGIVLGGAGFDAALFGCTPKAPKAPRGGERDAGRIAIIGAGIAGLHAAYRLQEVGVSCTVYEASARTGGRMLSNRKLYPGQVAELGGEFIDSGHVTMHTLAREFGIQLDDRTQALPAGSREIWWLGEREVSEELLAQQLQQVAPSIKSLITRIEDEQDSALFKALDETSLQTWLDQNVARERYPELHLALAVAYRGEFGREPHEQSCLNLIYLVGTEPTGFEVFGESDERFHAHLGNQSFVEALAQRLRAPIELGARLVRCSGEGPYELEFAGNPVRSVTADRVIFALPFSVLRQVDMRGLALGAEKRQLIAELGYGHNVKLMGGFAERVWHTQACNGSVTSDQSFQQCWDTSVGQPGTTGILTNFLGGEAAQKAASVAENEQYGACIGGLEAFIPGVHAAFMAGSVLRMDWCSFTFSRGSYSCYLPGQWKFWGSEGQRVGNLHFAGEHTSLEFQGFMEGAAESGARVAGEVLDDIQLEPSPVHGRLLALEHAVNRVAPILAVPRPITRRRARAGLWQKLLEIPSAVGAAHLT